LLIHIFLFSIFVVPHGLMINDKLFKGNYATVLIYEKYKSRTEVETVFDMYKNILQADRSFICKQMLLLQTGCL